MIIRFVLAYAIVAFVAYVPGLIVGVVAVVKTWREANAREDA